MVSKICLVNLVLLFSFLISLKTCWGVTVSEEELQWEKEFELLKKPSLKTIKTQYGDIYDCVDFYKQPAFDHPLLKNHNFNPQMRPSSVIKPGRVGSSSAENVISLEDIKLKDGGCPTGSVPIRRVSKDEFIRSKRFTKQYASSKQLNGLPARPGTHLAIAQSKLKVPSTLYNGVGAVVSIHNPSVTPSQYSSAEIIIQNGDDSIQVGWTVNPTLYNGDQTRFFQYLNAGESHCFNTLCSGFVSVRADIPIDFMYNVTSKYGHIPYIQPIFVYQDAKNGNWWLEINDDYTTIGFWPQQIFTGLANSASYIAVGGEAYGPPDQPLPKMGNGHYPVEDSTLSAYFRSFIVLDENHKQIDTQDMEEYRDLKNYAVYDVRYTKHMGRLVYYGGPY